MLSVAGIRHRNGDSRVRWNRPSLDVRVVGSVAIALASRIDRST
jgi:hypothetical protein